jgi:hypothetical protein
MLHYEALRQLTHEHTLQREREAGLERLALQARGRRQRRRRWLGLAAARTTHGSSRSAQLESSA